MSANFPVSIQEFESSSGYVDGSFCSSTRNCDITIRSSAETLLIVIKNVTAGSQNCRNDKLEIQEEIRRSARYQSQRTNWSTKKTLCFSDNLPAILTSGTIRLSFYSSIFLTRLNVSWTQFEGYQNLSMEDNGSFVSPGYPEYFITTHNKWNYVFNFDPPKGSFINLKLKDFNSNNEDSFIELRNGDSAHSPIFQTIKSLYHSKALILGPTSLYLDVTFYSFNNGLSFPVQGKILFKFSWTIELCQTEVNVTDGNLLSPSYPKQFIVHNTYMQWLIDSTHLSKSQLIWNISSATRGSIELRKGPDVIYKGSSYRTNKIISTENDLFSITYNAISRNVEETSFKITWIIEQCPIMLNSTEGILQSHGFPGYFYSYNYKCSWIITPYMPQYSKIKIYFNDFWTNNPAMYMEIRDGSNASASLIKKLSGRVMDIPRIFSTGDQLYLKFTSSNNTSVGSKFEFQWTVEMCRMDMELQKGVIKSPEYPNMYPINLQYIWTITTYSFTKIRIKFVTFDTLDINNYLEIRGGTNSSSSLVKKLYGRNQTIAELIYPGNILFLEFVTNNSTVCTGFEMSWEVVYGDKFTSPRGILNSPGFPLSYPDNFLTTWTITSLTNAKIRLRFEVFDTEYFVDTLEIRNGVSSSSPLITQLSGENLTLSDMVSPGRQLFLKFTTDHSHTFRGFKISWIEDKSQNQDIKVGGSVNVTSSSLAQKENHMVSSGCLGGCPENAECLQIRNNMYSCFCEEGYVGPNCQATCKVVGCPEHAVCVLDVNQEFVCQCLHGYVGETCQGICRVATCPKNSKCQLINNNQYQCICNDGFAGYTCQATCLLTGCPENAECLLNMNNQYECYCKNGFMGPTCKQTNNKQGDKPLEQQLEYIVDQKQHGFNASTFIALLVLNLLLMAALFGLAVYFIYHYKKSKWVSPHKQDIIDDGDNLECQAFSLSSIQSQDDH